MIGFLYPLFGLAILAAAVPVVLHLIRRRDVRRLFFPAIRYLRRAERRHARRLRLRHLALLALRVLIITLLTLAAMGPTFGRGGPSDHAPTALAIVIDDSQSAARVIGEQRLIDVFAERAAIALDLIGPDDRVALFSAVRPDRAAVAGSAAGRGFLEGLHPTAGAADLGAAIRSAAAWLEAAGDGRALEIHVLTDLQANSLPGALADSIEAGAVVSDVAGVVFAPDLPPLANGAPASPSPEISPLTAGRHITISVPLVWFDGEPPAEPTIVRLTRGDDVIAVAEAEFGISALMRLPPQDSGWVQGYVEIESEGLSVDDRRYFTWLARPAPRVALVGDAGAFVEGAVDVLAAGDRIRPAPAGAAEVWIAGSGARIEDALASARTVVVVPPADPLELPLLNSRLASARVPWRYEAAARSGAGASRLAGSDELPELEGLEVRRAYRLVSRGVAPADSALLRLADGEPWAIRGTTTASAAYVLLASPMTPEASDLPVSAGMVPFLDVALGDWARRGARARTGYDAAAPVPLPSRAREVRRPDGSTVPVEGGAWLETSRAGNYVVRDGSGVAAAFSVNAPLGEADLARGDEARLESILPDAAWHWTRRNEAEGWREAIFRARRGRRAWLPLVAILALASIVEAGLAAAGRRGSPRSRAAEARIDTAESNRSTGDHR
ncbi:MAG: hypothetical protein GWN99_12575 [Gemmatimonadetes bacterium]|uniref:Aerotolerance regulator N-terminal domain-containing protein n=1 Tax=Candidatus Kutchimonas denitrificans TaxID=3056748 RepID=A0AAE4ZBZ2_9BACT|nr:hypothetical protein [Gemmatimonadota bacterium]NIR75566.1 hypothetical protein [Candidatus Kutchimonas denitrificans]NIS01880.1 hypothetical protein [Gemmatimonadota bacterium]NIT67661.1 hypothetical protein [Gemmatimonadota bacterium]NIU53535.1 hypothetical protein [Gemmatimonadota bacterium]